MRGDLQQLRVYIQSRAHFSPSPIHFLRFPLFLSTGLLSVQSCQTRFRANAAAVGGADSRVVRAGIRRVVALIPNQRRPCVAAAAAASVPGPQLQTTPIASCSIITERFLYPRFRRRGYRERGRAEVGSTAYMRPPPVPYVCVRVRGRPDVRVCVCVCVPPWCAHFSACVRVHTRAQCCRRSWSRALSGSHASCSQPSVEIRVSGV